MFLFLLFFTTEKNPETVQNEVKEAIIDTSMIEDNNEKNRLQVEQIFNHLKKNKDKEVKSDNFFEVTLFAIARELNAAQGILFCHDQISNAFMPCAKYAYYSDKEPENFILGEGLHGQVAKNGKKLIISDLSDRYIISGLGKGNPINIIIIPIVDPTNSIIGIMELSFLKTIDKDLENLLDHIALELGTVLNTFISLS